MASWQANLTCFLLRRVFKPRLGRAKSAEEARQVFTQGPIMPPPKGVRVLSGAVDGVPGEWLVPDGGAEKGVLLYLHGGGYFACSPQTHRAATSAFALAGFRTFAPDYRLAPEHPFPAALEDAERVYRRLLEEHGSERLVVAGDSAGGGLSAALLVALRDRGVRGPAAAALFSPMVDMASSGESIKSNSARCAMFSEDMFPRAAEFYLGDRDRRLPLASPLYADLRGLSPLLIHVGTDETLLDDSRRFAAKAKEAGVAVELKIWPGVPHVWQLFHRWVPEGRASLAEAAEFLARHCPAPLAEASVALKA